MASAQIRQAEFIARWAHKLPSRVQQQARSDDDGQSVVFAEPAMKASPAEQASTADSRPSNEERLRQTKSDPEPGANDELMRRADEFRRRAEEAEAKLHELAHDSGVEAALAQERACSQSHAERALALEEELNELKAARTAGASLAAAAARGALTAAALPPHAAAASPEPQVANSTFATLVSMDGRVLFAVFSAVDLLRAGVDA